MIQSDSKVTLMYPKSYKSDPNVSKSDPPMTPKCPKVPRLTRSLFFLASPWPSWPLEIHWKNKHILLLGPFGSDTWRYDMHYKCNSTSIWRFGGPFFTFRPLSSIIFMKINPKATPTLKHKNVRIPSHRASQKLSRRSFGSKLNFVVSILYFYMDFHGFPWIYIQRRLNIEPQDMKSSIFYTNR